MQRIFVDLMINVPMVGLMHGKKLFKILYLETNQHVFNYLPELRMFCVESVFSFGRGLHYQNAISLHYNTVTSSNT